MTEWTHPAVFMGGAALLIPFLKEQTRKTVQWGAPLLAFLSLLTTASGHYETRSIFGLLRVDALSLLFGYAFTISSFIGMIYALHVRRKGEIMAMFIYAGAALGVVFSGDLWELFLFWEMMAFSSVFLVWFAGFEASTRGAGMRWEEQAGTPALRSSTRGAGMRYLIVHIFGGVCLLIGIVLYRDAAGTTQFAHIPLTGWGPALILLGVLINAAAVPFHAWLPDAYPRATIAGAVFMSALTTKTAVYFLIRSFAGAWVLIPIGAVMTVYGAVYAVIENDIRRILAYGIISQVGYMVVGVGIGGDLALNGASAHAFAHILYKGLLMMAAGAIIFMTGKRTLTELGGLYKKAPLLFFFYSVGTVSIAGVPLFSGFVTKSMIISAAGAAHQIPVMMILTLVSSGTFLYTGLRLPYFVFFGKEPQGALAHPPLPSPPPPANMLFAMGLSAFLCAAIGLAPGALYQALPFPVSYHPYTAEHIVGAVELLCVTAVVFLLLKKYLKPVATVSVDLDWFYRKTAVFFRVVFQTPLSRYEEWITRAYKSVIIQPAKQVAQWAWNIDTWVVDGLVNATGLLALLESRVSEIFDVRVVDGAVNGISTTLDHSSKKLRRLQTGGIQNYLLAMVAGVLVLAIFFMVRTVQEKG